MLSRICRSAALAARWVLLSALLVTQVSQPAAALPSGHDLAFDRGPSGGISSAAFPKWTGAMTRKRAHGSPGMDACAGETREYCGLARWQAYLDELRDLKAISRLRRVNAFINQVRYRSDRVVWGRGDYWAAPGEFFDRGGDCEDYAIAKFFALRQLGFANEELRIVVLWDQIRAIGHAVLAVYLHDEILILDNLSQMVASHGRYRHYIPQYSMNETTRWAHVHEKKIPTLVAKRN